MEQIAQGNKFESTAQPTPSHSELLDCFLPARFCFHFRQMLRCFRRGIYAKSGRQTEATKLVNERMKGGFRGEELKAVFVIDFGSKNADEQHLDMNQDKIELNIKVPELIRTIPFIHSVSMQIFGFLCFIDLEKAFDNYNG